MVTKRCSAFGACLFVLVLGACSSSAKTSSAPPTGTASPGNTTALLSAVGVTPAQLDAHLGVGVRSGWEPVDEGAARVWVPGDWVREPQGACIGGHAVGMISIGGLPQANCRPAGQWPVPAQAVALSPSSRTPHGPVTLTIHGYHVYRRDPPPKTKAWTYFDVPQLGVQIATHGTLGRSVLGTLAPSGRTVALDRTYETVPGDWHAVTENGVGLSIPPSWTVETPKLSCGSPFLGDSALMLIEPDIGFAPCPAPPLTPASALKDGASVYLPPHNRNAPSPSGKPVATLRRGTTTIAVYAEVADPNAVDLFVHRRGSSTTHVLTLGLGRDGRTAGGVLASLRADT